MSKTHQIMETSKPQHSPLPARIREHVCTEGDLNMEKALNITKSVTFDIPMMVPMNLVFQVGVQ